MARKEKFITIEGQDGIRARYFILPKCLPHRRNGGRCVPLWQWGVVAWSYRMMFVVWGWLRLPLKG
ncbi:Uncharacterised protein [Escherichia coli]|nr:Uncharacterised protein [Escherichia coli]